MAYISEVYKSKIWKEKLRKESFFTLLQFAENISLSAQDVTNMLNKTGFTSEYKNVHEKVQRLVSLRMIKRGNKKLKNAEHGKIYYEITPIGLFYVASNLYLQKKYHGITKILENHYDDAFFRYVVHPYFDSETVSKISRSNIKEEIAKYFYECSEVLINHLFPNFFKVEKKGYILIQMFLWEDIANLANLDPLYLKMFLKQIKEKKHVLKWLNIDKKAELKKIDSDKVSIRQDDKIIYLEMDEGSKKVSLIYDGKKIHEYRIQSGHSYEDNSEKLMLCDTREMSLEDYISDSEMSIREEVKALSENLVFFLMKGTRESYSTTADINEYSTASYDRNFLLKDKKFMKVARLVKIKIDNYFVMSNQYED